MAAAIYNFDIEQGSDFEITFVYNDENGLPVDLSNKCVVLQMEPSDGSACYRFSSSANATINSDGWHLNTNNNGEVLFKILSSLTNQYDFDTAIYDLDLLIFNENSINSSIRLATGSISVIKRNALYLTQCPVNRSPRGSCDTVSGLTSPRQTDYSNYLFNSATFISTIFNNATFSNSSFNNCSFSGVIFDGSSFAGADLRNSDLSQALLPLTEIISDQPDNTEEGSNDNSAIVGDLCIDECLINLDLYSVVYNGSGLTINDNSTVSGSIQVEDNRNIDNIELAIDGLSHQYPQDISMILIPPSGSHILLSGNQKIRNFTGAKFSYILSNKANPGIYLHNTANGGYCNIYDKTQYATWHNEPLVSSFNHLYNTSASGLWTLLIIDNDPGFSGSIDSWKLIITYTPEEE